MSKYITDEQNRTFYYEQGRRVYLDGKPDTGAKADGPTPLPEPKVMMFELPIINKQNYPKTFHERRYCGEASIQQWLGLFIPLILEAGERFVGDAPADQRHVRLGVFRQSATIERIDALSLFPEGWEKAFADPKGEKEKILSILSLGFDAMRASPRLNAWLDAVDQARRDENLFVLTVGGQFLVESFRAARKR